MKIELLCNPETSSSRLKQLIAHNYGHGGSGWTLAPGSARHVNRLINDELAATRNEGDQKRGIDQQSLSENKEDIIILLF
jgi:hypothetical protein